MELQADVAAPEADVEDTAEMESTDEEPFEGDTPENTPPRGPIDATPEREPDNYLLERKYYENYDNVATSTAQEMNARVNPNPTINRVHIEEVSLTEAELYGKRGRAWIDDINVATPLSVTKKTKRIEDPANRTAAMESDYREYWVEAEEKELKKLMEHHAFDLVKRSSVPRGKRIFGSRTLYKVKWSLDNAGEIDKFKARWVIQGFGMKKGKDYDESFSPTTHPESVKTVLYLQHALGWKSKKYDISNFFLNGNHEGDLYCELPEGLDVENKEELVCKVRASVYGTASAPHQAGKLVVQMMRAAGLVCTQSDTRVFIRKNKQGKTVMICMVHVDDIMMTYQNDADRNEVDAVFKKHFEMTEEKNPTSWIGLEVKTGTSASGRPFMHISQEQKIEEFLTCTGMTDSNASPTPVSTNATSVKADKKQGRSVPYMTAVGKLIWLLMSRFETAFATSLRCRAMANSTLYDDQQVKRLARYLKGTPDYGLVFQATNDTITLVIYCDAAFADGPRSQSTGGYFVAFQGDHPYRPSGVVCAKSFRERLTALSTLEAEYYAAVEAAKAAEWYRGLLMELGFPQNEPTVIYTDNRALLDLAANPVLHARTKHFRLRQAYLRDLITRRVIAFVHIPGEHNIADMLTKALTAQRFQMLRDVFMGTYDNLTK